MKIIIIILALSIFILKSITTASDFTFSLSLEKKSSIQVAVNVWNNPLIKLKMKDQNLLTASFFQDYDLSPSPTIPRRLKTAVFQIIENLELPIRQTNELIYIIEPIGIKLFDFLSDIHKKLDDFDEDNPSLNDYIDNIQWTIDGQIDHAKTLLAVFNSNVNKNLPHEEINDIFMFVEACKYSHLYEIIEIWNKILLRDKQNIISAVYNLESVNIAGKYPLDQFTRATIYYWISRNFENNISNYFDPDTALGLTRGMLVVHNRNYLSRDDKSLKIFLLKSRLTEEEEDDYIRDVLLAINGDIITSNNFVFLMQRLTREWRLEFLKYNQEYSLTKLIDSWPWRYIYFDIFEESLINKNSTIIDYQNLLTKILDRIEAEYAVFRNSKQTSLWMLGKFWFDYKDHFSQGLIDTCWPWTNKQLSKYRVLTDIIRAWRIKHIDEKSLKENCPGFRIDRTQYYGSLYDIGEYILKTPTEIQVDEACGINTNVYFHYQW
ncbi:hypothetical protein HCN44_003750 [Aphidius gifuensis]|uniref:Venom protein n=1 Tax=Aphidius gifuensis TaxID=684658 RepID=A0A835CL46_APHGI|nr:hypothetical protein HCN44_003750 [Aphidius gifuensis]